MVRRFGLIMLLATALLGVSAQTAFGWANGGDGGQGIGTHDWILGRAISMAGTSAAWVDRTTAYRATDDPDTYNTSPLLHTFKEKSARGGPYAVSEHYYKAVVAYRKGDRKTASKELGILSHYYTDVCQPFHATNKATKYRKTLHGRYEHDVGAYQHRLGNVKSWVTPRPRQPVTNVRAKTIAAAKFARSRWPALLTSYRASYRRTRKVRGTTLRVTKEVQSRAANDLADIIRSIPKGEGLAPLPEAPDMHLTYTYPRQGQSVGAIVTCTDSNGKPMEGVGVKFIWNLPTGTKSIMRWTGPDGEIHWYQDIGKSPLMQTKYVTAFVPASGASTSSADWYMATKPLADGTSGLRAWVSNSHPKPGTDVTGYIVAKDTSGNPVVGIPVTFTWSLDGFSTKYVGVTDSRGIASGTRNMGRTASGTKVRFSALLQAGGRNRGTGWEFTVY